MLKLRSPLLLVAAAAVVIAIPATQTSHAKEPATQAEDSTPKPANPADLLPPGDGRDLTVKTCSQCHAVTTFSKLRYSKDKWDSVLNDMISKGMNASDDDLDTVEKYLTTYLIKKDSSDTPSASKSN